MQSCIRFKDEAMALLQRGKTYTEIQEILGVAVPPSTLCTWFKELTLSPQEQECIILHGKEKIRNGSIKAAPSKRW